MREVRQGRMAVSEDPKEDPKWAQFVARLWSHKETLAEALIVVYLALQHVGVL